MSTIHSILPPSQGHLRVRLDGPGKLCQALSLTLAENGCSLGDSLCLRPAEAGHHAA